MAAFTRGTYVGAPDVLEARQLATRILGAAWNAERGHFVAADGKLAARHEFEGLLEDISLLAKAPSVFKLGEARDWLRPLGPDGSKLATQLGRASSWRSGRTHWGSILASAKGLAAQGNSETTTTCDSDAVAKETSVKEEQPTVTDSRFANAGDGGPEGKRCAGVPEDDTAPGGASSRGQVRLLRRNLTDGNCSRPLQR